MNDGPVTRGELDAAIAPMRSDIELLKADVAELKTDVAGLKTDVAGLKTDVAEFRREFVAFRDSTNTRFDTLAEMIMNVRTELTAEMAQLRVDVETTIVRTINAAHERFRADFGILDDQAKAQRARNDETDARVAELRADFDAHRADRKLHRKR